MKSIILATAAVLGLGFAGTRSADAGGISFYYGSVSPYGSSYGLSYSNYGRGSSYLNHYNHLNYNNIGYSNIGYPNIGYRGHRNAGHYDYVPTLVVPHGNHYDVIPGGYYYHQGSHGRGRNRRGW